jgi:hypothetical protein
MIESNDEDELYRAGDFEQFWRIYVRMHHKPATQRIHAVATTCAMLAIAHGLRMRRLRWILFAPLVDYAIAQSAHRLVESNRTQPYRNPPWHLRAELRMWFLTITGQMADETRRALDAHR